MGLFGWIKRNKLAVVLLLILGYLFLNTSLSSFFGLGLLSLPNSSKSYERNVMMDVAPNNYASPGLKMSLPASGGGGYNAPVAPAPEVKDRMVVQNSYLSLVVKNVSSTLNEIKSYTTTIGGYMVNSNLDNPQDNTSGSVTLRIPSEKLDETLAKFRSLSVKVASERLDGTDVTDQFVDNEARMQVLNANMARFKELMGQAKEISDILNVQQQVFSLQSQIDSIKGQNKYMEQTAKMSLVTIYLSTDEYSLPYAPSQPWRPDVIFKTAVRSMISNLRSLGSVAIWLFVYAVIWLPVLLIILFIKSKRKPPLPPVN